MVKKKEPFHKDALVLILLAVVFSAIAVIMLRSVGADNLGLTRPIQKQVLGTETPAELMKDLEMTGSDLEFPEFDQLKNEVKGL